MFRTQIRPFIPDMYKKEHPTFVLKSSEIPEVSRQIDYERLMAKPNHKPSRLKFDKNKTDCLKEKENNP